MKDWRKVGLRAKNALKIEFVVVLIFTIVACKATRKDIVDKTYELKKMKSKQSNFSSITINAYDFEFKKELAAIVDVNDVVFFMEIDNEEKIAPLVIIPNVNNSFNIEISYMRRHTVKVDKFFIKRGDSIIINAFLKEDKRLLID